MVAEGGRKGGLVEAMGHHTENRREKSEKSADAVQADGLQ